MQSIQTRLAAGMLVAVSLLLLLQWLLINTSIHSLSESYLVTRLQHDADALVAAVSFDSGTTESSGVESGVIASSSLTLDHDRMGPIYKKPYSGHYYQIHTLQDQKTVVIRSRSLWDAVLAQPQDSPPQQKPPPQQEPPSQQEPSRRYQSGPDGQQLLVLSAQYTRQGRPLKVDVAEDLTPVNQSIDRFLRLHTWVTLGILLTLLLVQFFIIKVSLRPLETIRRELSALRAGESDRISELVPKEIRALVKELNISIETMQKKVLRSRHTAGNLAHALKTPLALLRQLAETDSSMSTQTSGAVNRYIVDVQNIVDSELRRSRLAGRLIGGRRFQVKPEIEDLLLTLSKIHFSKKLNLETTIPLSLLSPVEREDLHEMLGNVLDNAFKWAQSTVRVSVSSSEDVFEFCVEDDGKELGTMDDAQIQQMQQRGKRLDESVCGHGLGLSIVAAVVEAYGGTLLLQRSTSLHGLSVRIQIPGQESVLGRSPSEAVKSSFENRPGE
ncbi:MAG: sensor histidine kinase [Gammaproteobacteria bacterium]|nr:sensor histidine kinase [Gammaproteobacteria bacterium]MDH5803474.1 sensor histidine kinase [Gammaproteobacteria bacterium]